MSEQAPSRPVVVKEIMDLADEYAYAAYLSVNFDYAVANKHLDHYRSALEAAITRLAGECERMRAKLDEAWGLIQTGMEDLTALRPAVEAYLGLPSEFATVKTDIGAFFVAVGTLTPVPPTASEEVSG